MNRQTKTAETTGNATSPFLTVALLVLASATAWAQVPVDEDGNTLPAFEQDVSDTVSEAKTVISTDTVLSINDLETLVGPIALYPDDLLAIVLPASTYPLEIVQAARFLERLDTDSSAQPDDDWDDSIVALLNYPEVVRMMDDDLDWTWRLGEAVISQQSEVIAAVEAFRDRAYAAGNLKTDENQTVTYDQGGISIAPVDEEIIYVPYYEPAEVVVYQPRRVYHYYPDPYPVYYYPYPVDYRFRSGYFWGVTTAFSIGWQNHYLSVYHPTYWGHPYYGRNYYGHYYRYPSISVYNSYYVNNSYRNSSSHFRNGDYWRPRTRAGSRQDEPRVRNYHYPPGGDQRRRNDYSSRNQLNNRDNGRLNLDLRERSQADRNRTTINSNGRATVNNNDTRRSNSTGRARTDATTSRQGNRASSNDSTTPRVSGGGNRERTSSGGNDRPQRNETRSGSTRPEIQLRNRGESNESSGLRNQSNGARTSGANDRSGRSVALSAGTRPEIQFRNRADSNDSSGLRNQTNSARANTAQRQPAARNSTASRVDRATAPRTSATPTFRQRAPSTSTAPRSTSPRNLASSSSRQSSPSARTTSPRTSAPSVRQSAPRSSVPAYRQSSPSARTAAPRASAPSVRQSAPRASAPRASAPRASAPSASATRAPSSSGRSSASRSSGSSRSSSSSRARSRNN